MAWSIKVQSRWVIQNMRFSKHLREQNDLHKSEKQSEIKTMKCNETKQTAPLCKHHTYKYKIRNILCKGYFINIQIDFFK